MDIAYVQLSRPKIEIYRYQGPLHAPELVIASHKDALSTNDSVAKKTYSAALEVINYYKKEFNRSSYDNNNSPVKLVVGYKSIDNKPLNNAFWSSDDKTMYFGDGDQKLFSPLGTAYDIVAHEFVHAVVDSEVSLVYSGEQGAIHETVADILATGIDGNLLIGEDAYTPNIPNDALRDLQNPKYKNISSLPVGTKEPHEMGEPLSYAAVLASSSLGLDRVRKIWYTAIVDNLKAHSGFIGFRQATESAALSLYGVEARQSISDAWNAVGLK